MALNDALNGPEPPRWLGWPRRSWQQLALWAVLLLALRLVVVPAEAREPLTQKALREQCRMRTATLGRCLQQLTDQQRIVRRQGAFALAHPDDPPPQKAQLPDSCSRHS